jgi:small subunit ribosomal protein S20
VATHASAVKAHRQSVVHRERNRKYRSQLRTTLKQIRAFIRGPANARDQAAAEQQLNQAVSLIDKMAGKGIIHRNTASRYKSRLNASLSKPA